MRLITLFVLLNAPICLLMAQIEVPPANWSFEIVQHPQDTQIFEIRFVGQVPEKHHIYSMNYDCPVGPLPSQFIFATSPDCDLVGEAHALGDTEEYDDIFECTLKTFHHTAVFAQSVRSMKAGAHLKGVLEYQMCAPSGLCVLHKYEFDIPIN